MARVSLVFTEEFVSCFETPQGRGPRSDDRIKRRIANAHAYLWSIFRSGVSDESLAIEIARRPATVRRNHRPPKFGELYADFSNIAGLPSEGIRPDPQAYACLVHLPRFRIWLACAFVRHPAPKFVVYHAGSQTACLSRQSEIACPETVGEFLRSLLALDA